MAIKITTIALFTLCSFFSFANSPNTFWSEDFVGGIPSGWTTEDLAGNDIVWEHCDQYLGCTPEVGGQSILPCEWFFSSSFEDGFVHLSPYQIGGDSALHQSVLTTPVINCQDKNEVYIEFNSLIISGNNEPEGSALLQVKIGNGTWTSFTIYDNFKTDFIEEGPYGFQSYNPHATTLDLSSLAANETDVQIRWIWKWTGNEVHFWGLDDVRLFDGNPIYDRTVWGDEIGEGDFNGSLNNWTISASTPDECTWGWSEDGLVDNPDIEDIPDFYVNSPTFKDGSALVVTTTCIPPLSSPTITYSELISPIIDLSDVQAGTQLDLKFHQTGALGNQTSTNSPISKIRISLNGGGSYLPPINLNPEKVFDKVFNETVTVPLPEGAAGLSSVRVKFIYDGFCIFWAVDDVRIVERYENDLKVSPYLFAVASNYSTPTSALQPILFQAEVSNVGTAPQELTTLFVDVFKDNNLEIVFSDTLSIGTIEPGETAEELLFEKRFTPEQWRRQYTCRYRVQSIDEDENLRDNTVFWKFETSDTLFSKNKGPASINAAFAPFSNKVYEIGNCFFVPPGSQLQATSVNFAYGNKSDLDGTILKINLYKWKRDNTFADDNNDNIANFNEYERITNGNIFDTDELASVFDPLSTIYNVPISEESPVIDLEDSTYYFVTITYDDVINNEYFPIAGSEEVDYTSTFLQTFEEELPQYVSMLRLGASSNEFLVNSWGLKRVPYVELVVKRKFTEVVEKKEVLEFDIFPNPAREQLMLRLNDSGLSPRMSIDIFDIFGRKVLSRQIENGFVSQIPIQVSELSNGSYILRVVSGDRIGSKKFMIVTSGR